MYDMYDINKIRVNTTCADANSLKIAIILTHILVENYEEYEKERKPWHIE